MAHAPLEAPGRLLKHPAGSALLGDGKATATSQHSSCWRVTGAGSSPSPCRKHRPEAGSAACKPLANTWMLGWCKSVRRAAQGLAAPLRINHLHGEGLQSGTSGAAPPAPGRQGAGTGGGWRDAAQSCRFSLQSSISFRRDSLGAVASIPRGGV